MSRTAENPAPAAEDGAEVRIANSKLYFNIAVDKQPVLYSSAYDISFLGMEKLHPFDSTKWGRICTYLMEKKLLPNGGTVEPLEATEDDLLVGHTKEYLQSLRSSINVAMICELPPIALLPNFLVQRVLLRPFRHQVGGTVLGAKLAKEHGWSINIGGGFHHCCASQGGGFCAYADISIAIRFAFVRLGMRRVMIIDLDAHQGNGHERDFTGDARVYILDMFNKDIYPSDTTAKEGITLAVALRSGTDTKTYLKSLEDALQRAGSSSFKPDLVIYNAGTDILVGDTLGQLNVSAEGVIQRDEMVFSFARSRTIPILMVTSGGYQRNNARVIADSVINLSAKKLISLTECETRSALEKPSKNKE